MAFGADGCIVVRCVIIRDVGTQHEVLAAVSPAAVHLAGQQVEARRVADAKGIGQSAVRSALDVPQVVGICQNAETGSRRGVFAVGGVAGNGGLHIISTEVSGHRAGVGAVLCRAVLIGHRSRAQVRAAQLGVWRAAVNDVGTRHGEAVVRRLGDGGSHGVGIVHRRVAVIALARVVIDGISAGIGGRHIIHIGRIAARSAHAVVHRTGIVVVIVR